ncbi:MAG: hypothetical protein LH469_14120 [Frankiaceae bacterium]|nr:hypothetical protein [Frankiaceae bacterium]
MRQIVELVRGRGARELLTSHVSGEGGPAGFYAKLGFAPRGDLDPNGAIILRLDLRRLRRARGTRHSLVDTSAMPRPAGHTASFLWSWCTPAPRARWRDEVGSAVRDAPSRLVLLPRSSRS